MNDIKEFRKEIDIIDEQIVLLIKRRLDIMPRIAEYKSKNNMEYEDSGRVSEIISARCGMADELKISPGLIEKIFLLLIEESTSIQNQFHKK